MERRQALRAAAAAGAGLAAAACSAPPSGTVQEQTSVSEAPQQPARTSASAIPQLAELPAEITHGPRSRPAVALTFHGQGDPALVDKLLSELEARGARGTILAVGSWLDANPALAQRILAGGHELGNHTQNHVAIARMNARQAFAEIDDCARTLRRLTGSIGTWFRPSQTLHSTSIIRTQARRVGYRTCLSYDVDSLDYTDPPTAKVVETTLAGIRNGSIVSLHCGHVVTTRAIGPLLAGLTARGLHTVTMTELMRT